MQIKKCTTKDVPQLAVMNKRLIEDERSNNSMNVPELEERMRGFLRSDYAAYFFEDDEQIVGYALVRHTSSPLYLRQFYIERDQRRKHLGEKAFHKLLEYLETDIIDIDVLPWNEAGIGFWESLGFKETCVSMRFEYDH